MPPLTCWSEVRGQQTPTREKETLKHNGEVTNSGGDEQEGEWVLQIRGSSVGVSDLAASDIGLE